MKKVILALAILLISLGFTRTAYAGSLNQYEAQVMDAAEGVFTYNGEEYQLDKPYVNMVLEYMMSDDIDLSKEQRDKVLSSMNSYVESGVQDGYLVKVTKPTASVTKGGKASDKNVTTNLPTIKTTNHDNKTDNLSPRNTKESAHGDFFGGILSDSKASTDQRTIADQKAASSQKSNSDIIKNTGFNLNKTVLVAVLMGVLMLAGIIVTIRNNFFAQSDE